VGLILLRQSHFVSGLRYVNAIVILACFACLGAGLAVSGLCDGGDSLILFGAAIALVGVLLFRLGAWATVIPIAIATLTLVAGGLYGASVAGCHW
jgi:hypothetical protein